jgi:hypothetical protein
MFIKGVVKEDQPAKCFPASADRKILGYVKKNAIATKPKLCTKESLEILQKKNLRRC